MTDESKPKLFNVDGDTYDGDYKSDLLEQYKLYVLSAENVSTRRVSTVRYLLTANAALVALYGFQTILVDGVYRMIPVGIAGLVVSTLSYFIIKSYRDLNQAKYTIIGEIEKTLPLAMFDYEWWLARGEQDPRYRPVSEIEQWIPIVFFVLHLIAIAFAVFVQISGIAD